MIFLHRLFSLLLALLLALPAACAEEKYTAFPKALRITQSYERTALSSTSYSQCYYPKTCQLAIDAELRACIDRLAAENLPYLPRKSAFSDESAMVDTGATVYRTGTKWASFLIVSTVMNGGNQLRMSFDARAYDMENGTALCLSDVLLPEGMAAVQKETAAQLRAYFPQHEPNEEALQALVSPENLLKTPFTLSPAFLQLHFPSEAVYDHNGIILHVRIPYTQLSSFLTEEAGRQTDNSRYRLIALTYDDGPTRRRTLPILRSLRSGGINATFFVVGERIANAKDLIALEHNAGFAIASHNYEHVYPSQMTGKVQLYRDKINDALYAVTGKGVSMMRAPGGHEQIYIDEDVGLPLIRWTLASKDGKSTDFEPAEEAVRLIGGARDGSILLMHDLRKITADYTAYLPQLLNSRGYLCVTVEELFLLRGIELQSNTVYYNAYPDK